MTSLQQRVLAHLVEIATGANRNLPPQKATAWESAKRFAELHPAELAEMPKMLTAAMLSSAKKS